MGPAVEDGGRQGIQKPRGPSCPEIVNLNIASTIYPPLPLPLSCLSILKLGGLIEEVYPTLRNVWDQAGGP